LAAAAVRPAEILELLRLRRPELDRTRRVLAAAHDVESLRSAARRRLPRAVFDYVDGGCEEEQALAANRQAYRRSRLHPRVLVDVADVDTTCRLFGHQLPVPIALAPTGYTRMMHPEGEVAVARAAASRGVPYALSTVGTTSIEDLAATGHDQLWLQLYVLRDRELSSELVSRAAAAGMTALEVTVDTAAAGLRIRDMRNGLTIPPGLGLRTVADILAHVGYWSGMLTSPPFRFANLHNRPGSVERITTQFDPALDWNDLADLRRRWPRRLIVKGPLGPADARRAVEVGADALQLSNHGGRQLDRCVAPLDLVRPVREVVGESVPILVDSGIRSGADAAIALAVGADVCVVGRPYLYGLAAAGEPGVAKVIDLLAGGLRATMQLLGVTSLDELRKHGNELVRR
jgi:L-lactate dehydrogenase (cytochrome)